MTEIVDACLAAASEAIGTNGAGGSREWPAHRVESPVAGSACPRAVRACPCESGGPDPGAGHDTAGGTGHDAGRSQPTGRTGPLRNGNPRGNPNLAPRCGAKARSGFACRAPAMANGRCQNHGGKCTGPRTAEGLARLAAANTRHGDFDAHARTVRRFQRTLVARCRVFAAAFTLQPFLTPEFAARVAAGGKEIGPVPHYSNVPAVTDPAEVPLASGKARRDARGRFAARPQPALHGQKLEREAMRREAALLTPWRVAIAEAKLAKRAALDARKAARCAAAGRKALQRGAVRADGAIGGTRFVRRERETMDRETVWTDGCAGGMGQIPAPQSGPEAGPDTQSVRGERDSMDRETVGSGGLARSSARPFRLGCWGAPRPTIWRCSSWRRTSRAPVDRRPC